MYVEIINPDSGQPAAEGESGEIVFTTLTRRGMSLIRYRTGDLSYFIPHGCPCGTILKTLARVISRLSGYVRIGADSYLTIADLDETLFPIAGLLNFSATITNESGKDCLHLEVKIIEGVDCNPASTIQQALNTIPSIRQARQTDQLDLLLGECSSTTLSNLAKRVILDHRSSLS